MNLNRALINNSGRLTPLVIIITVVSLIIASLSADNSPRDPPFDVVDSDFVSAFGSSISNRLIVAHATRAWRGDSIRALIGVNGSEEMARVCMDVKTMKQALHRRQ